MEDQRVVGLQAVCAEGHITSYRQCRHQQIVFSSNQVIAVRCLLLLLFLYHNTADSTHPAVPSTNEEDLWLV